MKDKQPTTAEATDEILKDEDQIGPRITPDDIEQAINSAQGMQFHQFPKTTVTVCCLTLGNGFCVIGKSAAVSEENFNVDIGMEVALDDVRNKLWELLGFRLKQALFEGALTDRP